MMKAMRNRLKKVAAGTTARKKAKMPTAARGKKTTKAKAMDQMRKRFRAKTPAQIKGKGMSPGMKKAITGAATGMSGAGLMALARKIKTKGRLNAADLDRVKKMMGKQKGGKMTPEQLKKIGGPIPFVGTKSPAGMKPVLDSQGNPVKNLLQKDDRKRGKRRPGLRRLAKGLPARRPKK